MASAHGKAGEGATARLCDRWVAYVDEGDDVLAELAFEELETELAVLWMVSVDDLVVGNDYDHGLGLPFCVEVVQDEVSPAVVDPVVREFAAATHEVEDGIFLGGVVSRRCIHVEVTFAVGYVRVVNMAGDGAVGNVLGVVVGRFVSVYDELAVGRHAGEGCYGIGRVGDLNTVYLYEVGVDVGSDGADGEGPDAVVAFFEREGVAPAFAEGGEDGAVEGDGFCLGGFYAEGDSTVVVDFGRVERSAEGGEAFGVFLRVPVEVNVGLLGVDERRCEESEGGENGVEFHGWIGVGTSLGEAGEVYPHIGYRAFYSLRERSEGHLPCPGSLRRRRRRRWGWFAEGCG